MIDRQNQVLHLVYVLIKKHALRFRWRDAFMVAISESDKMKSLPLFYLKKTNTFALTTQKASITNKTNGSDFIF